MWSNGCDEATNEPAGTVIAMPDEPRTGYRDVADELRRWIDTGKLMPGSPVPSEKAIQKDFGVNRVTAGRALEVLRAEGLIFTLPRRGSFVRQLFPRRTLGPERYQSGPFVMPPGPLGDFRLDREFDTAEATAEVAEQLKVRQGTPVLHRRYLLWQFGIAQQVTDSYLPLDLVEGTALASVDTEPEPYGNVRDQLATLGVTATAAEELVRARMPREGERELFNLPSGVPVLTITRTTFAGERPVEAAVDIVSPADRAELLYRIDL